MKNDLIEGPWTSFMDMYSGGGSKENWEYIYIQAPKNEARVIFYNRFGHSPDRVSCTCCGEDYSVKESKDLKQATGYERNCAYEGGQYVEVPRKEFVWGAYCTVEEYITRSSVRVIPAGEILPEEREGEVPVQGYIWAG